MFERHGLKGTPEYDAWHNMIQRCTNPNHPDWDNYGGRGITVCYSWRCFVNFLRDIGIKPHPDLTLERIENSKGYEPGNVKWATMTEQASNKRPRSYNTFPSRDALGRFISE